MGFAMTDFVLMLLICEKLTGGCEWKQAGSYSSEQVCVLHALAVFPNDAIDFRCDRKQTRG